MKKRRDGLYVLQMVVWPDEKSTVTTMILASGLSESSYLRQMCGLDTKKRGAPLGNKNRRGKKRQGKRP